MKQFRLFSKSCLAIFCGFFSTNLWATGLCHQRPQQEFVGWIQDSALKETSGLRFSVAHPDLIYHIADSHNKAQVFVSNLKGQIVKAIPLQVTLKDSEAMTLAPCGGEVCLVIGDIGDNNLARPSIQLYFFRESRLLSSYRGDLAPDFTFDYVYPKGQGPLNAETLWTDPKGKIFLFTKTKNSPISQLYFLPTTGTGISRSTEMKWIRTLDMSALPRMNLLGPIGKKNGLMITDADFNYQSQNLAVITYQFIFEFRWSSLNKKESQMKEGSDYVVHTIDESRQYEGISYLPHSETLYFTNEMEAKAGKYAPLWMVPCSGSFH